MVVLAAVLLVGVPVAVRHRPAGGPCAAAPTAELVARVQASGAVGWSGPGAEPRRRCSCRTTTPSPPSGSCSASRSSSGPGGAARAAGASTGSAARARRTRSATGAGRSAGSSSPSARRSPRSRPSGCPTPSTSCPRRWVATCSRAPAADEVQRDRRRRVAGVDAAGLRLTPGRRREHRRPRRPVGRARPPGCRCGSTSTGAGAAVPALTTAFTDVTLRRPGPGRRAVLAPRRA